MQINQIPMVIFPECTKTNRHGVLSIRSNLMDSIYSLVNEHERLLLRSEFYVKKFIYFNPNNTTDSWGIGKLFWTCCQLYNTIEIFSQDISNTTFEKESVYDRSKFNSISEFLDANLQSYLTEPNYRNVVSLTAKDHISFLEYFNQTSKDKDGSYVKKE